MEKDKKLKNFIKTTVREFLMEALTNNDVRGYEAFYHQTDEESAQKILKNGFNTPEVWVSPDDTASYGNAIVMVYSKVPKRPFVLDYYTARDYNISHSVVDKNKEFYEHLGGEANPKTFDKLRELGYDVVIEDNGDRAFLFPNTLKYEAG